MPPLRSRAPRWREATRQPELAGRALRRGRLQLARLRAAYPGYRVWTDVTFAESAPGTAIPVVCVGSGDDCTTRIHYDERQRIRAVLNGRAQLAQSCSERCRSTPTGR